MRNTMSEQGLQLCLEAGQSLPVQLCWRISDGYLRATGSTRQADIFTLGIWGPGEILIPERLPQASLELRALSTAKIHAWAPRQDEIDAFGTTQIQQLGLFLQITRLRPAEERLLNLLIWLSERFGSSCDQGQSLPLQAMNLTHRQLAEMASVSRVTVTKALGQFRQKGWLLRAGNNELLSNEALSLQRDLH